MLELKKKGENKRKTKIEPKEQVIKIRVTPITKAKKVTTTQLIRATTIRRYLQSLGYNLVAEDVSKRLAILLTEKTKQELKQIMKIANGYTQHSGRKTVKTKDIQQALNTVL